MPSYTLEELIKMMEPQAKRDKELISRCIDGLGLYAGEQARTKSNSSKVSAMYDLVKTLVEYWGLNDGKNAPSTDDFLRAFDNRVTGAEITESISDYHAVTVYGLYRYGQDMIVAQGDLAMSEILFVSDLMKDISAAWDFKPHTVSGLTAELESSVRTMLDSITLPGQPESGEDVHGYKVRQAISFNNDRGIAFAENPGAPSPFVTWQFTDEGGSREFYWGHYFGSEEKALIDYISRAAEYMENNIVTEKPIPQAIEAGVEQPLVTVTFSEYEQLRGIEKMPLYLANTMFFEADEKQRSDYVESGRTIPLYLITEFRIEYIRDGKPEVYSGQYNIGTGDETLTEHIEDYAEYYKEYLEDQESFEYRGGKKITGDAQFDIILNELVPFFDKHCELSRREADALSELMVIYDAADGNPSDSAKVRIEYLESVVDRVHKSRAVLNSAGLDGLAELSKPGAESGKDKTVRDGKTSVLDKIRASRQTPRKPKDKDTKTHKKDKGGQEH